MTILCISVVYAGKTAVLSISAMYEDGIQARMRIIGFDLKGNIDFDQNRIWIGDGYFQEQIIQIPKSIRTLRIENVDEGILVLDYFLVNNLLYDGASFISGEGCSVSILNESLVANCAENSWMEFTLANGNPVKKSIN